MQRDSIDLCGTWLFQPDVYDEGEPLGYHAPDCETRQWREVVLPAPLEAGLSETEWYEGAGWYRRTVRVPDEWVDKRITLQFAGVNYHATVWVNGTLVGSHIDGFLPFSFPVNEALQTGQQNLIAVRVDNVRRAGEVPGRERGWRPYGGILREVTLAATNQVYIVGTCVVATPGADGGTLRIECTISNASNTDREIAATVTVVDGQGAECALLDSPAVDAPRGDSCRVVIEGSVPGAPPWCPDNPALYTANIALSADGVAVDQYSVRVGFRRIEATADALLLNGRPIFLTGFNRHEDSPVTGMCPDMATTRSDLRDMQRLGANFVRLCHYPHHPAELDLCDELGVLAMVEIPLYWWNGLAEGEEACARKLDAAKRQLSALIARDCNHPAVVFWSVSNETQEQRPEVIAGNAELVRLAKQLDPTRLAVHVAEHWHSDAHFEDDDVMCVNHYPSHWHTSRDPLFDPVDAAEMWTSGIQKVRAAYPDKPVLVTEFGYPGFAGVHGGTVGEDRQVRVLEAEFSGIVAAAGLVGVTIWCYADHPWPEENFVAYTTTSPFGIVTRGRRHKAAWRAVQRLFRAHRGRPDEVAPIVVSPEDMPVHMLRPHMRDLPRFDFPESYSIRPMRLDEVGVWTDIQRDAEPFIAIDDGLFMREFGDDLPAITRRCFLITGPKGVAAGTISGWYSRDFKGQDYGRIHWVAVRPAYQGRGLAKAAMSCVMAQLAEWHTRAWLATSTGRIGAIKIYLDFGFVPDMDGPNAETAWRQVRAKLDHPGLAGSEKAD
jgi:beta-glucuronidase